MKKLGTAAHKNGAELRGVSQVRRNAMCTKYPLLAVFLAFTGFGSRWATARGKR